MYEASRLEDRTPVWVDAEGRSGFGLIGVARPRPSDSTHEPLHPDRFSREDAGVTSCTPTCW